MCAFVLLVADAYTLLGFSVLFVLSYECVYVRACALNEGKLFILSITKIFNVMKK